MDKFLKVLETLFEKVGKNIGKKWLLGKKEETIAKWNKKIDIKYLSEKDEKLILEAMWDALEEVVTKNDKK